MTSTARFLGKAMAAAILAAAAAIGCESANPGTTGGRIDPYRTTEHDRGSHAVSLPALLEFCDTTAQALARDLVEMPEITDTEYQVALELGKIANHTRSPTSDFEMIQRRLSNQILKSRLLREHFMVVESRGRVQAELDRAVGRTEDLLQEGNAGPTVATYDPAYTWVLLGDFHESIRGNTRRYYFEFNIVNLATRQRLHVNDYTLGQQTQRD